MGSDALHPLEAVLLELSEVAAEIDPVEMDELVKRMADANRIFVAGMGRSGLMAQAFAMRLMHLKLSVFVVGETTTPSIKRGDLLICCSRYGRSRSLRTYIEKAHEAHAEAAVITMSRDTPLAKQADHVFTIPVGEGGKSRQPMGTIFEQSALIYCDALVLLAMKHLGVSEKQMAQQHTQLE